jgi:hypothetical protein
MSRQTGDDLLATVGEAELISGWAEVALREECAASIDAATYPVFVTSYDTAALFGQNRTPRGLEIHAMSSRRHRGHATVRCAYQVAARPKAR